MNLLDYYLGLNFSVNYCNFSLVVSSIVNGEKVEKKVPANTKHLLSIIRSIIDKMKKLINLHISKYNKIIYTDLENLMLNQIIINNGNEHKPFIELFCKLFIDLANNKTKNKEYYGDKERTTINRLKWSKWFNVNMYSNNTELKKLMKDIKELVNSFPSFGYYRINESGEWYWSCSQIGFYLNKIIK